MGSSKLLGTAPDQVPTNADLGGMAFQDANAVKITGGDVTANHYVDTAISEVKPSLLLDFANGRTLDPRITFTRSTTATYYDGRTAAKAEENLFTYSNAFKSGNWNRQNVTALDNTAVAPDGTTTAWKVVESATADYHGLTGSPASTPALGSTVTVSIYAKAGERTFIQLSNPSYATFCVIVNLSTGAVAYNSGSVATVAVTSVGNGWYRIAATYVETNSMGYSFGPAPSGTVTSNYVPYYTGDGASGIYVWGAQLEQRSGASAYTPTTSSPVTNYIPALQTAGGGAPRFDHDPITGESKGLLIEEQRTNLLTYSNAFTNTAWNLNGAVTKIDNATIAPDGTLTAALVTEDVNTEYHFAGRNLVTYTATAYTVSVYVKYAGRKYVAIQMNDGSPKMYSFDILNGVLYGNSSGGATGTITSVGNGWHKCSVTATMSATSAGYTNFILSTNGSGGQYKGDGASGIYLWGAQLEAGAFPTSYIPTTFAQVTRAIDWANISGANFSSTIRADEGTIFWEASTNYAQGGIEVFDLDTGSNANRLRTRFMSTQVDYVISGNSAGGISLGAMYANTSTKLALAFRNGDQAASMNGGSVGTTNVTGVLPFTYARIGGNWAQSESLNGTIKKLAYYPKRLSNAELQEMTQ